MQLRSAEMSYRTRHPWTMWLAGLLLAVPSMTAAQLEPIAVCEDDAAPQECQGADIRIQETIPTGNVCENDRSRVCVEDVDCDDIGGACVADIGAQFGFSIAIGYLNGDRFADLVAGAPGDAAVYVFYGGVDNASPAEDLADRGLDVASADVVISSADLASQLGFSVAVAPRQAPGDLSNPVILGAPAVEDATSAGSAYVIPASYFASTPMESVDVTAVAAATLVGEADGDQAGYSVAIGSVRNVGGEDFVVGARLAGGGRGRVYAVDQGVTGTLSLGDAAVNSVSAALPDEGLGEFLGIGDLLNNDGTDEVAIGAVGTLPSDTDNIPGRVYIVDVSGGDVDLSTDAAPRAAGDSPKQAGDPGTNDFFGFSLVVGDFDDDGAVDLVVGAIYADRPDDACGPTQPGQSNAGALYFFDSGDIPALNTADPPTDAGTVADVFWGFRKWDELGFSMAAGDVNGDGDTDLIAGARRHDRDQTQYNEIDEGAVYVMYGGTPSLFSAGGTVCLDCPTPACDANPPGVDAMIAGGDYEIQTSSEDQLGFSVAAGDLNGDARFADVAVSSVTHERVYVVSIESTDAPPEDASGQETDDWRDMRDRDDDGDGYLDTEEDRNTDGLLDADESDPLFPNVDITVDVVAETIDPFNAGEFPCDETIEITVTVTNVSRVLDVFDPQLMIELPPSPFEYVPNSLTIDGANFNFGTFPFAAFRYITETGAASGTALAVNDDIEVVFELRREPATPCANGDTRTGDVTAHVQLLPADEASRNYKELPESPGIGVDNDDTFTVTKLVPTLSVTKTSLDTDLDGTLEPLDILRYTIEVENVPTSDVFATDVVITDVFDSRTTFESGTLELDGTPLADPPGGTIVVNVGTIPVGTTVTVIYEVEVGEEGLKVDPVENDVTIEDACIFGAEAVQANASDPVTVTPSVEVVKAGVFNDENGNSLANPNETITYTITVTNDGNVTLTDVNVTDPLLATVTCPSGNPIPTLAIGASEDCTGDYAITQADIDAGSVVNTATANATDPDDDPVTDDSDPETTILAQNPAYTVTKEADGEPDQVSAPGAVNYTIEVTNTGNVSLTGIVITDALLGVLTLDPADDLDTDGELDVGESWTYTGSYAVTQEVIDGNGVDSSGAIDGDGDIDNTVSVTFTELPVAQTASETVAIVLNADYTVTKEADGEPDEISAPGTIDYTIEVTNTGNTSLTGISISDPLLVVLTLDPADDLDTDGELDVGESWTYTGSYDVTQAVIDGNGVDSGGAIDGDGDIDNTVSVTFNELPVARTASDTVAVVQTPSYTVTKEADGEPDEISAPGTIDYTIEVTNTGNISLTGISITDPLLVVLTLDPADDLDTDGELDVGESWTYTGSYTVTQAVIDGNGVDGDGVIDGDGDIDNTVSVTFTELPVAQTASETVAIVLTPAYTVTKEADGEPDQISAPGTVNYTIEVTNTGNVALTGISITDALLGVLTLDPADDLDTDGELDVGESWTYTGSYDVTQAVIDGNGVDSSGAIDGDGDIDNTVSVTFNELPVAQTASETVAIVQTPSYTVTKEADGEPDEISAPGTIDYTIEVTNTGNISLTGIAISDPLLVVLTLDPADDLDTDGELDVGESWTYTGSYDVTQAVIDGGGVDSSGAIDGDGDIDNTVSVTFIELPVAQTASETVAIVPPAPPFSGFEPRIVAFDGDLIDWSDIVGAVNYHLYRGDLAVLRADGTYTQDPAAPNAGQFCWLAESTYTDSFDPPTGEVVFYLITADDGAVEGSLGTDSAGTNRPHLVTCR